MSTVGFDLCQSRLSHLHHYHHLWTNCFLASSMWLCRSSVGRFFRIMCGLCVSIYLRGLVVSRYLGKASLVGLGSQAPYFDRRSHSWSQSEQCIRNHRGWQRALYCAATDSQEFYSQTRGSKQRTYEWTKWNQVNSCCKMATVDY